MTPYKLPEPTPKGAIADRGVFRSLVSGSGYLNPEGVHERRLWGKLPWVRKFWEEHAPELADFGCRANEDEDVAYAQIRHLAQNAALSASIPHGQRPPRR